MLGFIKRFLGDNNDKEIKRMRGIVDVINGHEKALESLSDDALAGHTGKFKERLANGESLDDMLPEAFAVVREASRRVLGMRHFDVQMIGGICLHEGKIAEMRTGEGKTLVATTAVYLNALAGKGVHMVTVNDYLARRDSEWMGKLYRYLGLTVGLIAHNMDFPERKAAYAADVTFGTNNEFGFDYLRDNMVLSESQMVQRHLHYAIVDEVDSILIDEARTPLIISGPGTKSTDNYRVMAEAVRHLKEGEDYTVDEKAKTVAPTDSAVPKIEKIVGISNLYAPENIELSHCFTAALRAKALMHRDRDYVVKGDEIIIVDEFTGRLMEGRRYSDGLHQAIEAKEGVKIQRESQTLASITFQNYFRMYEKLAGMTGTAKTEENEFLKIYKLPVIVIPTNKPIRRIDEPDVIYKTKAAKYRAVGRAVKEIHETGQPILIGTTSITQSEELSAILKKHGVEHNVLNAKYHEKEAEIIKDAGQRGAVTIATNMAGRGTDIKLGEGVEALGGLYIVGTERHESRRIDNQLRGRSGRQGDPGDTKFFISLEDDLMRKFGGEKMSELMDRFGIMDDDEPIEAKVLTKRIEGAQRKVEGINFGIRKSVLEYDDVMNVQREIIYKERRRVLEGENITDEIQNMIRATVDSIIMQYMPANEYEEEWDLHGLFAKLSVVCGIHLNPDAYSKENLDKDAFIDQITTLALKRYHEQESQIPEEQFRELERVILLQAVDSRWMDHIDAMDQLRQGIGLRALGQENPVRAYQMEGFDMFDAMNSLIQEDTVRYVLNVTLTKKEEQEEQVQPAEEPTVIKVRPQDVIPQRKQVVDVTSAKEQTADSSQQTVKQTQKVGRNDECPCGSGKKYKKCCGKE